MGQAGEWWEAHQNKLKGVRLSLENLQAFVDCFTAAMGIQRKHAWTFYFQAKKRPGRTTFFGPSPSDVQYTNIFKAVAHLLNLILHNNLPIMQDFKWVVGIMSWAEWAAIFGIIAYKQYKVSINFGSFHKAMLNKCAKVCSADPIPTMQEEQWVIVSKLCWLSLYPNCPARARCLWCADHGLWIGIQT